VLITGAGLVGAQIALREQAQGREPVLLDLNPDMDSLGDVLRLERCTVVRGRVDYLDDVQACISDYRITRIIHTAAHGGLTGAGITSPFPTVQTNVMGTATVLEAARLAAIDRVVLCSSSTVHVSVAGGGDHGVTTREEAYPRPVTVYAATKQASEDLGRAYGSSFGLEVVVVRFPAVFGPWRAGGGGRATARIAEWVRSAVAGKAIELDPPAVDWVYSKDAAHGAHLACWVPGVGGRTFHIGMGQVQPAAAFRDAFASVFPGAEFTVSGPPLAGDSLTTSPGAFALGIDRARERLGFEVEYPLARALRDYAEWMSSEMGR
jgi:UDP-glucose 4-epimerase